VGYITVYGHHAGDPRYVLVLDHSARVLSPRDAARAKREATPFLTPGAMSERERELAHEAWSFARDPLRLSPMGAPGSHVSSPTSSA